MQLRILSFQSAASGDTLTPRQTLAASCPGGACPDLSLSDQKTPLRGFFHMCLLFCHNNMNLTTLAGSSRRFVCKLLAVICSPSALLLRQRQICSGTDVDAGVSWLCGCAMHISHFAADVKWVLTDELLFCRSIRAPRLHQSQKMCHLSSCSMKCYVFLFRSSSASGDIKFEDFLHLFALACLLNTAGCLHCAPSFLHTKIESRVLLKQK